MRVLKCFAPHGTYLSLEVSNYYVPDFELYQVFMHNCYAKLIYIL